jgi:hypothetical protein
MNFYFVSRKKGEVYGETYAQKLGSDNPFLGISIPPSFLSLENMYMKQNIHHK